MDLLKRIIGSDKDEAPEQQVKPVAAGPRHVNEAEFDELISQSEHPVLVDFWAEWCGPCHAIAPAVAKLAEEYAGRALVAKVDADECPEIVSRYGIMGIPTLIYFKDGEEADRVIGVTPYSTLKTKLDHLVG